MFIAALFAVPKKWKQCKCPSMEKWIKKMCIYKMEYYLAVKKNEIMPYCSNMDGYQVSRSVMSDSLWPHELQYARPPCPSPTPEVHPNPYPLSRWCHPTISSSFIPFSSCLWSFPASGSFLMSGLCIRWPKYWSFTFSIRLCNKYSGLISFRINWFDLFAVQGTLKCLLQHHSSKASILWHSAFFMVQPHILTWLLEKP